MARRKSRLAVVAGSAVLLLAVAAWATLARPRIGWPTSQSRMPGANGTSIIVIDSTPPGHDVRLLWLEGRPAAVHRGGVLVEDGASGLLEVSPDLHATPMVFAAGQPVVASAASAPDGSTWIVDGRGRLSQYARDGAIARSFTPGLPVVTVSVDQRTSSVWLVRSSSRFTYRLPGESSPLFERLAAGDTGLRPVGRAQIPAHSILADLQNSGHLVARGDTIWFAPFIRDEVLAMTAAGDTLWRVVRGLPQTTVEPRFELVAGRAVVDYHPVNLGLVLGTDGKLLVLSTPMGMAESGRLDEIDPSTGRVLATATLPNALPTLAEDAAGRIYSVDPAHLLIPGGGVRSPLAAFDLAMSGGGRLRSDGLRGRPALLNFWASWCGPCRHELPALDSLRRELVADSVPVIGMNDDRDSVAAVRFLASVAPAFPTTFGLGRLQEQFGYVGLPWTLLIDATGQVVGRWTGELTAENLREIRRAVALELRRLPVNAHDMRH